MNIPWYYVKPSLGQQRILTKLGFRKSGEMGEFEEYERPVGMSHDQAIKIVGTMGWVRRNEILRLLNN